MSIVASILDVVQDQNNKKMKMNVPFIGIVDKPAGMKVDNTYYLCDGMQHCPLLGVTQSVPKFWVIN